MQKTTKRNNSNSEVGETRVEETLDKGRKEQGSYHMA